MSFNSLFAVPLSDWIQLAGGLVMHRPVSSAESAQFRAEYSRYYDGLPASVEDVNRIKRYLETILRNPCLVRDCGALAGSALDAVQAHVDLVQALLSKSVLAVARDVHGQQVDLANARATQDAVEIAFRRLVLRMLTIAVDDIRDARPFASHFDKHIKLMDAENSDEVRAHVNRVQVATGRFSEASDNLRACLGHTADVEVSDAEIVSKWPTTLNVLRVFRTAVCDIYRLVQPHFALERIESARRAAIRQAAEDAQAARVAMAEAYHEAERAKVLAKVDARIKAERDACIAAKAKRADSLRLNAELSRVEENSEENTEEECEECMSSVGLFPDSD